MCILTFDPTPVCFHCHKHLFERESITLFELVTHLCVVFPYWFTVLSAGAIPVVYADGWLPPFNEYVVDWSKCAVFIPESDYSKTGEILRAISEEKRCEMQTCVLNVWDKFAATRAGWVRALVAVALSTSAFGINPLE